MKRTPVDTLTGTVDLALTAAHTHDLKGQVETSLGTHSASLGTALLIEEIKS